MCCSYLLWLKMIVALNWNILICYISIYFKIFKKFKLPLKPINDKRSTKEGIRIIFEAKSLPATYLITDKISIFLPKGKDVIKLKKFIELISIQTNTKTWNNIRCYFPKIYVYNQYVIRKKITYNLYFIYL